MKIYPKRSGAYGDISDGFTKEEIENGTIYLYIDVVCKDCGKIQSLANSGSTDNGRCILCGGETK